VHNLFNQTWMHEKPNHVTERAKLWKNSHKQYLLIRKTSQNKFLIINTQYFKLDSIITSKTRIKLMLKESPNLGTGSLTLRNDPRILPLGGFLRKTKINKLPQIINVLIGNMSIVGPRPQMKVDFLKFPKDL
jgi:hypothetical protein